MDAQLSSSTRTQGGFVLPKACWRPQGIRRRFPRADARAIYGQSLAPLHAETSHLAGPRVVKTGKFLWKESEYGCKTVSSIRRKFMSCKWESNKIEEGRGSGLSAWVANIVALRHRHGAAKQASPGRQACQQPVRKGISTASEVAQASPTRDWQPAPNACAISWPNRQVGPNECRLQHRALSATDPIWSDFQVYIHATAGPIFSISAEGAQEFEHDIETGGNHSAGTHVAAKRV